MSELGAVLLLVEKAFRQRFASIRVVDDDVMPGLRVGTRRTMARGFQNHLKMLLRHLVARHEFAVGHPVPHHIHQRVVPLYFVELSGSLFRSKPSVYLPSCTPGV